MARFISYVLIFIMGFAVCAGIYYAAPPASLTSGNSHNRALAAPTATVAPTAPGSPASARTGQPGTTIYAVQKVEPSVVNIDITGRPVQAPTEEGPFGNPMGQIQEILPQGTASGVIISSDGYILTNNHVAANTSSILVTLRDGRRLAAHVVGLDPRSDLAVIKVDATGLPAASIGRSTDVQVGQWIIAVGNPLGIGTTATAGIVSAIRSPFTIRGKVFPEIIQSDAAINPGNSGGALADLDGNIIGINTAIASTSGGSIGLGFAIPINMAMDHARQLIQNKTVIYPWLGIKYLGEAPDRPLPVKGVPVSQVVPDGPADHAGLQAGDILTRINGRVIDEPGKVNYLVMQHHPGETVTLSVWRNGQSHELKVTLGRLPSNLESPPVQPEP